MKNYLTVLLLGLSDAVVMADDIQCQCTNTIPAICVMDENLTNRYYTSSLTGQLFLTDRNDLSLPTGYNFPMRNTEVSYQRNSFVKTIHFNGGQGGRTVGNHSFNES